MSLTNYRDVSKAGTGANPGFQFEFLCGNCSRAWTSPYKPYRRGQLSGLIYRFAYLFDNHGRMSQASDAVAGIGVKSARAAALQAAIALAEQRYTECPGCRQAVCEDCWNPRTQRCTGCDAKSERAAGRAEPAASSGGGTGSGVGPACPNCQAAFGGGRFCAECGFDMASTHKSCPGCGAMCTRTARFCNDCGHGF
jgi:hypothetical protein